MAVDSKSYLISDTCISLLCSAWVTFLLRCYVRIRVVKSFGSDDWCMVLAQAFLSAYGAELLLLTHYGAGRHLETLSPSDVEKSLLYWLLCEIFYCITLVLIKISIGLFFLRIVIQRSQIYVIYGVMASTTIIGLIQGFFATFQCTPVKYFYDKNQPGYCRTHQFTILTYVHSAVGVMGDFTLAILPVFIFWNAKMSLRKKIIASIILSLGACASISTLIRLQSLHTLEAAKDFLYAGTDVAIWSFVEAGLGATAGCCATLRPLFHAAPWSLRSSGYMRSNNSTERHNRDQAGHNQGLQHYELNNLEGGRAAHSTKITGALGRSQESSHNSVEWEDDGSEQHLPRNIKQTTIVEITDEERPQP